MKDIKEAMLRVVEADRDALWNKLGDTQVERDNLRHELDEAQRLLKDIVDAAESFLDGGGVTSLRLRTANGRRFLKEEAKR